ncbi:preprotein translocase subunit SecY [Candidatus Woesearchaeota archaeon]|nr:preprotein translocase subunit SecY [Candidatus Woesearchaeota archaeon]
MSFFKNLLLNLPEVAGPTQKRLSFKEKLKWTTIILVLFFILGMIPLFGLGANTLQQFEYLSIILGAKFGSIISLGIGPIVTASIVLQLLNGSGLLKFDLTSQDGKKTFQGVQKLLAYFFILFESCIYVFMGGLSTGSFYNPATGEFLEYATGSNIMALEPSTIFALKAFLILQLCVGGLLIMLMDEIVSKWGFGSGISLFIAAGVSQEIFIRAFSWFKSADAVGGAEYSSGEVIKFFQAIASSDPDLKVAGLALIVILSTVVIFALAVYLQAMKIEIPLSFGRIRGHGIRWPLNFIYTSNIPVILVAALFANMQLWAKLLEKWGHPLLGTIDAAGNKAGIIAWINPPGGMDGLAGIVIRQGTMAIGARPYLQATAYLIAMVIGCVIFSYFWVQTAGMDARSQAKQIMSSGLQIPGFRKDQRVLERLLDRYIGPLTIMGAIAIGILAALADLLGALSRGTGILLAVMIVYKLYEEIAQQHMMDMHPALRKMMG